MQDLHATYNDATLMYEFLKNVVCNQFSDITIMSSERDFRRVFRKPKYQGDYLKQFFEWNCREENEKRNLLPLKQELKRTPVKTGETWE